MQHSLFSVEFIIEVLETEINILSETIKKSESSYDILNPNSFTCRTLPSYSKKFKWTGKKSELVEVLEAILLLGSINNGDVTKKDFFEFIGNVLHINLSNHNVILHHIYNRKDDFTLKPKRAHYLTKLLDSFSNKLFRIDLQQ